MFPVTGGRSSEFLPPKFLDFPHPREAICREPQRVYIVFLVLTGERKQTVLGIVCGRPFQSRSLSIVESRGVLSVFQVKGSLLISGSVCVCVWGVFLKGVRTGKWSR